MKTRINLLTTPTPTIVDVKGSVRLATAAALAANTRVVNVLTANANGAMAVIDGVAGVVGNRVLVKNEGTGANNGIYNITSLGSAGTPWILTRTDDANESAEVTNGLFTFVEEGTANASSGWVLTTANPITLNTTALTFTQFTGAGQITAGNGLSKTGNTLSINTAITADLSTAQTLAGKTFTGGVKLTFVDGITNANGLQFGTTTPCYIFQDAAGELTISGDSASPWSLAFNNGGIVALTNSGGNASFSVTDGGQGVRLSGNGYWVGTFSANDFKVRANNTVGMTMSQADRSVVFASTVDATGYKVATVAGIDAAITTGDLVGKTITVSKGIITGYA